MLDAPRRARVEEIRRSSERFLAELAEETYRTRAGWKADSEQAAIYHRHRATLSEESAKLIGEAQLEAERDGDADEARRLRYLYALLAGELASAAAKSITDELESREAQKRLRLGGEGALEIPFRKATGELANTAEREKRAEVEALEMAFVEELTPLLAERHAIVHAVARKLGHDSARSLWEGSTGVALADLVAEARGFLARTADMYRETMSWLLKKSYGIALADGTRHDLLALFRGARFDDSFGKREMVETAERCLREAGIDLTAGGRIELDLDARERKAPRAFSAEIEVPGRIILCLSPIGGRRDWQRFFHELGKALHRAYTDPELPFELRRLGDRSLHETYGFLLQYLLIERSWLKRYTGLAKPKDYLFLAQLEKLAFLRRYAARLCYEVELHAQGSVEGLDERYDHEMRGALGIRYPRALYLYDIDRGFLTAHYLRAWMFEALLRKHLVHYFDDDWFRNPRCGEFLRRQWRLGQRLEVEGLVRDLGYDRLSFAEAEHQLERGL